MPKAIWNRDINSEDELSVMYKGNYLPEPSFEPAGPSKQADPVRTSGKSKTTNPSHSEMPKNQVTLSDTDEDDEFD